MLTPQHIQQIAQQVAELLQKPLRNNTQQKKYKYAKATRTQLRQTASVNISKKYKL